MNVTQSWHEHLRLKAIDELEILDSPPEEDFDDLVKLASLIFNVSISTVTVVDRHRQWFKASVGLEERETEREISFCTHVVELDQPLIVENAKVDPRFAENPLVLGKPHLGFYAGIPLRTREGHVIGTFCVMDQSPRPFIDSDIKILHMLANQAMQLLELRAERIKLRESEQRWKFALEGVGDGVWDWDIKTGKTFFSPLWKQMLGYDEFEVDNTYQAWQSLVHPDDRTPLLVKLIDYLQDKSETYEVEHRLRCKSGEWKWILARGMAMARDEAGKPLRMIGTHTDISSRKKSEEVIWRQANFDMLTGLPNRHMFFERLKAEIKRAKRQQKSFAVLFMDLNDFKRVNDSLGHLAGDRLLKQVSRRISSTIRETDTLARLGGDEFTLMLSDVEDIESVGRVCEKIVARFNEPFKIAKSSTYVSVSIGISLYPKDGKDADTLISRADTAMYAGKHRGANCWIYSSG